MDLPMWLIIAIAVALGAVVVADAAAQGLPL